MKKRITIIAVALSLMLGITSCGDSGGGSSSGTPSINSGSSISGTIVEVSPCADGEHEVGIPSFLWSEDYASCVAEATCSKCGTQFQQDCMVTRENEFYTAHVTIDGKDYWGYKEGYNSESVTRYASQDTMLNKCAVV